jgi:hypothetical protein
MRGGQPTDDSAASHTLGLELATQQFLPGEDLGSAPDCEPSRHAGGVVPGTQEVSESAGGHDMGRAEAQLVLEFRYFIYSSQ